MHGVRPILNNAAEPIQDTFWAIFERTHGRKFDRQSQTADVVEEWDSLKHVELIFELEQAFGLEFSPDDIADMYSNTDTILELVNRKAGSSRVPAFH